MNKRIALFIKLIDTYHLLSHENKQLRLAYLDSSKKKAELRKVMMKMYLSLIKDSNTWSLLKLVGKEYSNTLYTLWHTVDRQKNV